MSSVTEAGSHDADPGDPGSEPDDGLDLRPRPAATGAAARGRKRPWPAIIVLVLVLVGGGVAVTKFLTSAIDYYCNVDEVGVKSGCEAGRRLRIQGTVEEGTVQRVGQITNFVIAFGEPGKGRGRVEIPVRYDGENPALFQECIPVVVHGELVQTTGADGVASQVFQGDKVEVKHSNEYEEEHQDRLDPSRSAACSLQQA